MKLKAIDIALLPQIARWLVELHLENELPINITLRPGHLVRIIKIEYEEKDREIVNWLLHKMGESQTIF